MYPSGAARRGAGRGGLDRPSAGGGLGLGGLRLGGVGSEASGSLASGSAEAGALRRSTASCSFARVSSIPMTAWFSPPRPISARMITSPDVFDGRKSWAFRSAANASLSSWVIRPFASIVAW